MKRLRECYMLSTTSLLINKYTNKQTNELGVTSLTFVNCGVQKEVSEQLCFNQILVHANAGFSVRN